MPRKDSISRTGRRVIAGMTLVIAASLTTGCKSNGEATPGTASLEEALLENQELRSQLDRADENLRTALEANRTLNERVQSLNSDLATARSEADELRNSSSADQSTAFDNIDGISVSRQSSDIVVEVAGDVLFDSGKTTLKNASKSTLNEIAGVIQANYAGNRIRVAGHTDTDKIRKSPWKTNERLSSERALAVEEYLASRGVDSGRIEVVAYGSAHPRATKRESRRVEIIILGAD